MNCAPSAPASPMRAMPSRLPPRDRHRRCGPVRAHRAAGLARGDGGFAGGAVGHRAPECRQCPGGQPGGRRGPRARHRRWRDRPPGHRGHGQDRGLSRQITEIVGLIEEICVPDQHPGAECGGRGCACRRRGARLCRRRQRGARAQLGQALKDVEGLITKSNAKVQEGRPGDASRRVAEEHRRVGEGGGGADVSSAASQEQSSGSTR